MQIEHHALGLEERGDFTTPGCDCQHSFLMNLNSDQLGVLRRDTPNVPRKSSIFIRRHWTGDLGT